MILDPGWNEVSREGSDFTLLRERVCISLSINTWGLDWTHLESLAVNEREREVTRLYRPIIICLGGTSSDQPQHWQHVHLTRREPAIDPKQTAVGWLRWSIDCLILTITTKKQAETLKQFHCSRLWFLISTDMKCDFTHRILSGSVMLHFDQLLKYSFYFNALFIILW